MARLIVVSVGLIDWIRGAIYQSYLTSSIQSGWGGFFFVVVVVRLCLGGGEYMNLLLLLFNGYVIDVWGF